QIGRSTMSKALGFRTLYLPPPAPCGFLVDEKVLGLLAGFDGLAHPNWLRAAARPGVTGFRIAILRRNFASLSAVNRYAADVRIIGAERSKLLLQGVGFPGKRDADLIAQLYQRIDRHGGEIGFGHSNSEL